MMLVGEIFDKPLNVKIERVTKAIQQNAVGSWYLWCDQLSL